MDIIDGQVLAAEEDTRKLEAAIEAFQHGTPLSSVVPPEDLLGESGVEPSSPSESAPNRDLHQAPSTCVKSTPGADVIEGIDAVIAALLVAKDASEPGQLDAALSGLSGFSL